LLFASEKAQERLRLTVEGRLDTIRQENATKLDEMRQTVDEKLQTTLETQLGESFNRVVEHLERSHQIFYNRGREKHSTVCNPAYPV
jgi:DNA recombination protein RmuC